MEGIHYFNVHTIKNYTLNVYVTGQNKIILNKGPIF